MVLEDRIELSFNQAVAADVDGQLPDLKTR